MIDFAELLVETVASADWAFFAKNGNDVTTLAVMAARAFTHRKKIVFFKGYYHGVGAWTQKIDYAGIMEEDVQNNICIDWNDVTAVERVFAENPGGIAAIIAQPYMHGNFMDNELPADGFWKKVRKLCTDNGALLIVGTVVSFIVSMVAIKALMNYVRKHSFAAFGVYRIALGAVVLVYFVIKGIFA